MWASNPSNLAYGWKHNFDNDNSVQKCVEKNDI